MENKQATLELGTKPVGKLLVQYALPAMIAMTASSLYNIVDRVFIGQGVGAMAISGLAITFPFMNLTAAFGAGVGVGASTAISVKLGQKDYATAQNILGNTISLNLIIGIGLSIICLLFLDPILRFFGASDQTLIYAHEYMVIILLGNVVSHMYFGMNALLRAASKPKQAMYATIFTVVMNVILDALFILVFKWGIQGAAIATILSQLMAMCWQFKLFSNKNELLHMKKGIYKLKRKLVDKILSIGISPFLMNVCACIIVIFINNQLVRFGGDLSVGAYGIANGIAMVFIMFVFGVNQGMQPIAGYNFGARKYSRVREVFLRTSMWATIITGFWFIASEFFPGAMVSIFTNDPSLKEMAEKGLRVMNPVVLIVGWQMVSTNLFQSLGMIRKSIFLSLSRQLLYLVPLLYLMPLFFDIHGVFAAFPISDALACVTTLVMIGNLMRKFSRLKDGDEPTILGSAIS